MGVVLPASGCWLYARCPDKRFDFNKVKGLYGDYLSFPLAQSKVTYIELKRSIYNRKKSHNYRTRDCRLLAPLDHCEKVGTDIFSSLSRDCATWVPGRIYKFCGAQITCTEVNTSLPVTLRGASCRAPTSIGNFVRSGYGATCSTVHYSSRDAVPSDR